MSILLDALKKSEEQRQLGKTPTIHSPGDASVSDRGAGRAWLPTVMLALAAVAMVWIGWQQMREPSGLDLQEPGLAAGQAAEPSEPAAQNGADPATDAAADETSAMAPADQSEPTEPAVARRPQLIAAQPRRTPVESFKADTGKLKSATVMPPPDEVAQGGPPRSDVSRDVREFQAPPPPSEAAPAGPRTAMAQPPGPPPDERAGTEGRGASEPISFWELPQGVRDGLPELRITVLVYAERPEDRFVLIAGQRIVEKERLGDGVVLDEIRRDGAVFEYRKYRFLVEG